MILFAWLNVIYGALRDLVPFVQFKKREKHPWRSVNFSEVSGFSNYQSQRFKASSFLCYIFLVQSFQLLMVVGNIR